MEKLLNQINSGLEEIRYKLSMPDSVAQIKNARFYLPNFPVDCLQRIMVLTQNYWDIAALNIINKYLPDQAVILDIGANIGNHTVYWALERNAKKIYSFEPLVSTFEILEKNIKLNNLENRVTLFNFGLFNEETNASVAVYNLRNVGLTSFTPNENGNFKLKKLDEIDIPEKIDLMKVDVEGAEVQMLQGAVETIKRNKPVIVIETYKYKPEVEGILLPLGYKQVDTIREGEDYIYKCD